MFSKSAQWYDALYSFKDYQQESNTIISLLKKEHPQAKTLLDVACGTAEHDKYFSKDYQVDGFDLNSEFVQIASQKNPEGQYYVADMTDFELKKTYDIILCLFSSIGYVRTLDNVIKTLVCFKKHLNKGGLLVVEPWFTPDTWKPDNPVHMLTAEKDDHKICRMNISEQEGNLSIINFHYLLGSIKGIQYFTECHELGLFSISEMKNAFKEAGFNARYDSEGLTGRGLYSAKME
jgi:ubiquinone/menaquinone biosynthesis C-methylase UbiE